MKSTFTLFENKVNFVKNKLGLSKEEIMKMTLENMLKAYDLLV